MAPNTLSPVTLIEESLIVNNEIVSIRLSVDMLLGDATNPNTWSGTQGQRTGYAHACIIVSARNNDGTSKVRLELICMRPFGTGSTRAKIEASRFIEMFLPLPLAFGATPPPPRSSSARS